MSTEAFLETCFVEGFNKIPGKKPTLFGSKTYPGAVIKLSSGELVAIELDGGNKGSKLRNALAKAGMHKRLIGDYAQIILFFLAHPAQAKQRIQITELERKVLKFYEELSTKLIIL